MCKVPGPGECGQRVAGGRDAVEMSVIAGGDHSVRWREQEFRVQNCREQERVTKVQIISLSTHIYISFKNVISNSLHKLRHSRLTCKLQLSHFTVDRSKIILCLAMILSLFLLSHIRHTQS